MFGPAVLSVLSSFSIISPRKRELIALLCVLTVVGVLCFVSLPRNVVGWSVIVTFHGHTYFLLIFHMNCQPWLNLSVTFAESFWWYSKTCLKRPHKIDKKRQMTA